MSDQITVAFVQEYVQGIEMLVQQLTSKIRDAVRTETQTSKRAFYDQIGAVAASQRTVRHEDTQYVKTPHKRRAVDMATWDIADLIDRPDMIRILNDPTNAYSQAFAAALARSMDRELMDAALGTSKTGETGSVNVTLPASQKIDADSSGFTLAKLKTAMKKFKKANAVSVVDVGLLYVAWTSFQEEEFIDTTEVKSIDYNTQKVLVSGTIEGFYGFKFIRLEDADDGPLLPLNGTTRSCVAWLKSGLLLATGREINGKIDVLPTKKYSTQVYADMDIGATRMQEKKVVQIDCVES